MTPMLARGVRTNSGALAVAVLLVLAAPVAANARTLPRGLVLTTGQPTSQSNDIELNLQHLQALKPESVRVFLNWKSIQPHESDSLVDYDWKAVKSVIDDARCVGGPREVIVTIDGYPDWAGAVPTAPDTLGLCENKARVNYCHMCVSKDGTELCKLPHPPHGCEECKPCEKCKMDRQLPNDRGMDGPWAQFVRTAMRKLQRPNPCPPSTLAFEVVNEPNQIAWLRDPKTKKFSRANAKAIIEATAEMLSTGARLAAKRFPGAAPKDKDGRFASAVYGPGTAGQTFGATAVPFTKKVLRSLACQNFSKTADDATKARTALRSKLRWSQHNYEDVDSPDPIHGSRAEAVLDLLSNCKTFTCKGHKLKLPAGHFLYLTEGGSKKWSSTTDQCTNVRNNFIAMRTAKSRQTCNPKRKTHVLLWSNYQLHDTDRNPSGMCDDVGGDIACDHEKQRPLYGWFMNVRTTPDAACTPPSTTSTTASTATTAITVTTTTTSTTVSLPACFSGCCSGMIFPAGITGMCATQVVNGSGGACAPATCPCGNSVGTCTLSFQGCDGTVTIYSTDDNPSNTDSMRAGCEALGGQFAP